MLILLLLHTFLNTDIDINHSNTKYNDYSGQTVSVKTAHRQEQSVVKNNLNFADTHSLNFIFTFILLMLLYNLLQTYSVARKLWKSRD